MIVVPPCIFTCEGVAEPVVKVRMDDAALSVFVPPGSIAKARHQYWVLAVRAAG